MLYGKTSQCIFRPILLPPSPSPLSFFFFFLSVTVPVWIITFFLSGHWSNSSPVFSMALKPYSLSTFESLSFSRCLLDVGVPTGLETTKFSFVPYKENKNLGISIHRCTSKKSSLVPQRFSSIMTYSFFLTHLHFSPN